MRPTVILICLSSHSHRVSSPSHLLSRWISNKMCGLTQAAESAFSELLKLKNYFLCCETCWFVDAAAQKTRPQLIFHLEQMSVKKVCVPVFWCILLMQRTVDSANRTLEMTGSISCMTEPSSMFVAFLWLFWGLNLYPTAGDLFHFQLDCSLALFLELLLWCCELFPNGFSSTAVHCWWSSGAVHFSIHIQDCSSCLVTLPVTVIFCLLPCLIHCWCPTNLPLWSSFNLGQTSNCVSTKVILPLLSWSQS